jgi:2',3'-cyclic-nucleotide 2'-phosphodiesterase (5'-nucleotidase family)
MNKVFVNISIFSLCILLHATLNAADFFILYSANINGTIQDCNCGKDPLGGIARIKTYIDHFREKNPNTLVIDGGDYFNSYPFIELNKAMLRALSLINYDIFVPGDQEFSEGDQFYYQIVNVLGEKLLISNQHTCGTNNRTFIFDKHSVHVQSYLSADAFSFIKVPHNLNLLPFSYIKDASVNGCNIVIFHGSLADAQHAAAENEWLDLILLAHDQYKNVKYISNVPIVGAGRDSEFIVNIAVSKLSNKWDFSISTQNIDQSFEEDREILSFIEEYHATINQK